MTIEGCHVANSQTGDLALMRELNQRIVLDLIRGSGPISRAELARRSRLSRSTISSIIVDLLAADLVHEVGVGNSLGGRRPIMIEFNYRSSYVIGVEVATTALNALLTDLQANIVQRARGVIDLAAGPLVCIPQIVDLIRDILVISSLPANRVIGVGIGVPGPLASATGRLIAPPVMPGWDGVAIKDLLERALGMRVWLENDANLGALAEQHWGIARDWRNVAYIYLGSTGIGSGLILDGRLYHGDVGSAGEIGHLTIDEDGPLCRCGSYGCLEAYVGSPALLDEARRAGLACRGMHDLIELAQQGEACAGDILARAGERLGVAIASLLNLLNPGFVVLGGDLATAGKLLLAPLRATLRRRGLAAALEHVEIARGSLDSDVVALGAVSVVLREAFDSPLLPQRHPAPARRGATVLASTI
jgi:predicted NBD/HSP70 family sugar kinase